MEKFDIVAEDYFNRIGEFFDELGETTTSSGQTSSPFSNMVRRMFFDFKVGVRNKENSHVFSDIKEHAFELDLVYLNNSTSKPSDILTEATSTFIKGAYPSLGEDEHVDIIKFTPRMGKTIFAIPTQYKDKTVIILTWFKSTVEKLLSKHGLTTLVTSYDEESTVVEFDGGEEEYKGAGEETVTNVTLSELEGGLIEETPEGKEFYPEAGTPYSEDTSPTQEGPVEPEEKHGETDSTYPMVDNIPDDAEASAEEVSGGGEIPLLQFGQGIPKTYLSHNGVVIPFSKILLVEMSKNEEALMVHLGHGVAVALNGENAIDFLQAYKRFNLYN